MSESYTIRAVGDPREWSSEKHGGRFLAYPCDLEDASGHRTLGVEWSRKHGSDRPKVGDTIIGDISNGPHGEKLKVDWDAMKEQRGGKPGGSRPAGKTREWQPESRFDPEKTARIGRAHAQHMAILTLDGMGVLDSKRADQVFSKLKSMTDFFEADVDAAATKAAQGAGGGSTGNGSSGAGPPAPAQDGLAARGVHERIATLLEQAGVNSSAATVITNYATAEMTAAEQDAVIDRLLNENTQQAAVKRLTERTEAHHGEPLPELASDADEIPF